MLKKLVAQYGKEKINTLTKYPSILTLHKFGEKGRLSNELTTPILDDEMYATEKIDGTNSRIICYGDEHLIGSREFILHHSDDLYYDTAQGIVDGLKGLKIATPDTRFLTVIYGEFYGGRVSSNSKWYGQDKVGFRVFDVALYPSPKSILEMSLPEISRWRERETEIGMLYGQQFLSDWDMMGMFPEFEFAPKVPFDLGSDLSHQAILDKLKAAIPETNVALSENAVKKAEGLILRNQDRTKIVKIRFEDYERTLRK